MGSGPTSRRRRRSVPVARRRGERALPGRLADVLDHDVGAAAGQLAHAGRRRRSVSWFTVASAPSSRGALELRVARRRDDRRGRRAPSRSRAPRSQTPLPIPQISTHSPGCRRAFVTSMRYAVSKTSGKAAASSNERSSGIGWTALRGTATSSAYVPSRCSPRTWIPPLVREAGVDHDALVGAGDHAGAVGAEDVRLRRRDGQPLPDPDVEVVERRGAELDEHLARRRARDRARPRSGGPRGRRPRGCGSPSRPDRTLRRDFGCSAVTMGTMTTADVQRLGAELGLDAIGVDAGRGLRRHRAAHPRAAARGLFGRLRLHDGAARGLVPSGDAARRRAQRRLGRALLLRARSRSVPPGHGRLPRYTWHDGYAELREKLDALGRALGAPYRVLVDANQHVDREAAARSGVGFYGKNTMLITRRHGSWVVLGTLVTTAELEPTPPLRPGCGSCTRCIDACPTGALDEPGVLDATRCLSYWTQVPEPIPEPYRAAARRAGLRLRHLPGRLPVEPRRRAAARRRSSPTTARTSTSSRWLDGRAQPRRRAARRASTCRATTRAGCGGTRSSRSATPARPSRGRARRSTRHAGGDDELLAEHARWALARLEERMQLRGLERWISLLRLIAFPFVARRGRRRELPAGLGAVGVGDDRRVRASGRCAFFVLARTRARRPASVRAEPRRPGLRHGDRHRRT